MNLLKTSLALAISVVATSSMANSLDQAQSIQNKTNNASASSQKVIDKSSQATLMLQAEIERLQEEVKKLNIALIKLNYTIKGEIFVENFQWDLRMRLYVKMH